MKLNFSDRMKHLRDFLNKGKRTLILTLSHIWLYMYRDKYKDLYLCMHVWLELALIYYYFVYYNYEQSYFCVAKLLNAMGIMPNSY